MSRYFPHLLSVLYGFIFLPTFVSLAGCSTTGRSELAHAEAHRETRGDAFSDEEPQHAAAEIRPDVSGPPAGVARDGVSRSDAQVQSTTRRASWRLPDQPTVDMPPIPLSAAMPGQRPVNRAQKQPPRDDARLREARDEDAGQVYNSAETGTPARSHAMAAARSEAEPKSQRGVEKVGAGQFRQLVLESDVPVVVDFYADWCGPCRRVTPLLDRFARHQADVRVVKVNIDDDKALARKYRVRSIPAVMVFQDGTLVARHTGLPSIRDALSR